MRMKPRADAQGSPISVGVFKLSSHHSRARVWMGTAELYACTRTLTSGMIMLASQVRLNFPFIQQLIELIRVDPRPHRKSMGLDPEWLRL